LSVLRPVVSLVVCSFGFLVMCVFLRWLRSVGVILGVWRVNRLLQLLLSLPRLCAPPLHSLGL
jgi:hypothetical protein